MNEQETIADIVAEMRRGTKLPGYWHSCDVNKILQYHAYRLEAAHKRELSKNVSKNGADSGQLGDAAKLRDALTKIINLTNSLDENCAVDPVEIRDIAKAALAAPPRNCDVGTADDWLARFSAVCERCSGSDCDHRQFKDEEVCDCFARWLQMPYVEKKGGAK